ncbi:MAG: Na/Pi cotransporter family protein [archaeon]|nr:Na/Pi cotransporter family protein [archaeon]
MDSVTTITAVLTLLAGIGVFLIACTTLSSNLESVCGSRLRSLFSKASDKKLVGVGIGAVGTAAIQSSGATTVLVIGFVNAGIMSLTLAAAVIYGANIGTTITAQIVALGMMGGNTVSLTVIFAALTGVGAFVAAYSKSDKTRIWGSIIAAFGMLFVGLSMMSGAMSEFAQMDSVKEFLASIKNLVLLVIIGAALTAVVQSSSVMTSVVITMLVAGLVDLEQGIYLTMGSNIGSCVVAIMAGFTSGLNAKRTAMIHLLFNVIGVVIFVAIGLLLGFATGGEFTYGSIFAGLFGEPQTQLAMFHTVFNVITVIIMLPLTSALIRVVMRIVPDEKNSVPTDPSGPHLYFVDSHMIKTPAIAILEVKNEIVHMAEMAMNNFSRSCRIICNLDFSEKEAFEKEENNINYVNKEVNAFLVKLSNCKLSSADLTYLSTAFHTLNDIERVGDYAENIVEYADKLQKYGDAFSDIAKSEIQDVESLIQGIYENVMVAYKNIDFNALDAAYDLEEKVDVLTDDMAENHIKRMSVGLCSPSVGAEFLALTSDVERIADHFINVGHTIKELRVVKPEPRAKK